jgi:hypothetical protein
MNFNNLYNRVVYNETKEKQQREEDVEQYDHSASVEEQEEEYYDFDDEGGSSKVYKWTGEDVTVKFPDRAAECVVEGVVAYTVEEEPPDRDNGWQGYRWPEVEGVEVTGIFEVGNQHKDAVDITEDVTFEEMEIAERALANYFEKDF